MSTNAPSPASTPKPGHQANGKFAKGNPGGPGNPFGRHSAALRAAFYRVFTDEEMERLARMLLDMAFAGNLAAARLVLQYTIGKPAAPRDPDRVDVDDWKLEQEKAVSGEAMADAVDSVPVDLAKTVVSAMVPEKIQKFFDQRKELEAERAREEAQAKADLEATRRAYAAEQAERAAQAATPPAAPPSTNVDISKGSPSTNGNFPMPPFDGSAADWVAFTEWLTAASPRDRR